MLFKFVSLVYSNLILKAILTYSAPMFRSKTFCGIIFTAKIVISKFSLIKLHILLYGLQ